MAEDTIRLVKVSFPNDESYQEIELDMKDFVAETEYPDRIFGKYDGHPITIWKD